MRFALAALLLALLVSPAPAQAQMACGERSQIVRALERGHEERKAAEGISGNGGHVEVFVSLTGTWTLLITLPGGPTCLLGSGEDWESWEPYFEPEVWDS